MPTAIINFGRSINRKDLPLADGSATRMESISLTDSAGTSAMTAEEGEDVLDALLDYNGWIAVGADPDAADDENRWPVQANVPKQLGLDKGDKVAVAPRS